MSNNDHSGFPPITTDPGPGNPPDPSEAWPEFEGYKIVQELPHGGQALVYKAIHISTKAKVALKVLPPGMLASAKARRRFEQEVDLATSLHHPHIVSIRDSGIAQGQYYFAMEYVSGQPLDRYVSSKSLPQREIMVLFRKVCDAVAHAHQRGVIHRDLKPSNILADERGNPRVLDFGLAKGAGQTSPGPDGVSAPSMTGEIKGTLSYMSPEQAAGRPELIDVRTDIYSLGVVLYRILTGEFPYDVSGTAIQTIQHIESSVPKRPKEIVGRFSSELEAILLKCLAKEPNRRYHSAAALGEDIQRWLDGLPILAKSVSSVYLLRKVIARHRIASLLLVIILAFSCISLHYRGVSIGSQREKERAVATQLDMASLVGRSGMAQVLFLHFLEAWHGEKPGRAEQLRMSIAAEGSKKEFLGVAFLLDPNSWETKKPDLRRAISPDAQWFADFVIAETYLKQRKLDLAKKAYRRSYQAASPLLEDATPGDKLLRDVIAGRLYSLDGGDVEGQSVPSRQQEGDGQ